MYHQDDTQEMRIRQAETEEVEQLVKDRRQGKAPVAYRIVGVLMGAAALIMWGFLGALAQLDPGATLTRGTATFLTFAVVVACGAVASLAVWAVVQDRRAQDAKADRIREHDRARQERLVKDALGVFLRDGDSSARESLERVQGLINSSAESRASVHSFRGRG